jgi:hypothetical protein
MSSRGGSVCYKCNQVSLIENDLFIRLFFILFSQVILLVNVQMVMVAAVRIR